VNLFWALDRMRRVADTEGCDPTRLEAEAIAIHQEDIASCRAIGAHGAALLPAGTVLTHCNAGALATGGYGTALGVIRSAVAARPAPRGGVCGSTPTTRPRSPRPPASPHGSWPAAASTSPSSPTTWPAS